VRRLAWLARRMGPESVFYPDWMQPDWLPNRRQQWLATTGLGLAVALAGLTIGLTIWLAFWPILPSALLAGLSSGWP
jgi:hypothetical protein